jgi:segregation and condensation protein B
MINEYKAVLEGILFVVGDEGISFDEIMFVLGTPKDLANEVILELKTDLESENRGLLLSKFNGGYRFITKPSHHNYYQRLVENPKSSKLSQAALETLAIIAYNQPITRMHIEQIRGVNADSMVRKLVAKALVKDVGRAETIGRPVLYSVTDEFLDYFGLSTIEELPPLKEFDTESVQEEVDLYYTKFTDKEEEKTENEEINPE